VCKKTFFNVITEANMMHRRSKDAARHSALAARGTGIVTGNDTGAGDSEFIMFRYNERSILGYVVVH
jgi:hypothetical protein